MKKCKILAIAIISIMLIMIIGTVLGANSSAGLDANNYIKISRWSINNYNNLYCVDHGQGLGYTISENGKYDYRSVYFEAVSKAEINGNIAKFTNYYSGNGTTSTGTVTTEANNIMAAIVSMECNCGKNCSSLGYGGFEDYTCAQMGVYYYYNTWVNATGATAYGFESGHGNTGFNDTLDEKGGKRLEKCTEAVNTKNYRATIYFMEYKPANNPGININNLQNLILVIPEEPTSKEIDIPVQKIWNDSSNAYGTRVDSITVKLLANNVDTGKTLTLNAKNEWKGIFEDLPPVNENGKEITYTIQEVNTVGYTSKITGNPIEGYVITNTLQTVDIPVQKQWVDDNNRDGKRPTQITITLYENGTPTNRKIALSKNNNWSYTFKGLPKYKNGSIVTYTLVETKTEGYDVTYSNNVITNTHEPERTGIQVIKKWNDEDDLDEYRPTSITVTLYANGESTNQTVVLNESNNWTATFEDLYKYEEGTEIEYTVKENVISNYEEPKYTKTVKAATGDSEQQIIFTIENTHVPQYDGYIEITGKVWLDEPSGKGNDINGLLDKGESGLKGIKVTLRDANGKQFDATSVAETDSDGNYSIKVNYDNSKNVYKLYEDSETVRTKLNTAYVEFEYDGMLYTTVKTAATGENTSKAIEDETTRNNFDNAHSIVTSTTKHPNNWTDRNNTAITKDVISFETYADKTTTTKNEVLKYCNGDGTYIRTNPEGAWNEILQGTRSDLACTSGNGHDIRKYGIKVEVIQNVNLGLFTREQPDVAIFSDLSKVVVTMQDQEYTYLYNVRRSELEAKGGLQVKFQSKDTYQYMRPINPADIAYINATDAKMTVKVTYEVSVGNLSTTLPITVHNITNYFDEEYTLQTSGWTVSNGQGFKKATNDGDLNITVQPGEESEPIELTYEVSQKAIKDLLKENATLNHGSEIQSYSTKYGENTLYAEFRTGGRTGQPYGGYDFNSHPGNAGIYINGEGRLDATTPEDDTDFAPSFVLCKDDEYKILSGNVWEDTDNNSEDNQRLGNGQKEENEKNVANVKVELYKIDKDGNIKLAKLYNKDGGDKDAITYTDANGNYSFGDTEYGVVTDKYMIKFTYGEEEKTSTINNINVDARNYKSTIISENSALYQVFKGTSNSKWHLNLNKGYSIAVDDIEQRTKITDLQYSNFNDKFNISAWSKPFEMQVEFDTTGTLEEGVGLDGESNYNNTLNIFDFGIIERAREDLFVEKTINNIKITLSNGQVLIEGNPQTDEISYTRAIGVTKDGYSNGSSARSALDKQVILEIDSELIQGAQLDIKYEIRVTNNSEKDFDYYLDEVTEQKPFDSSKVRTEYYYFGTNAEGSPEIDGSVDYLVDYIDAEINYSLDNPDNWTQWKAEELLEQGLISETTYKTAIDNNYAMYVTEQFNKVKTGETKKDYISVSKVLANNDENVFENHIEILKIDSKIARTINKQYKMGNYVPSLSSRVINTDVNNEKAGLHEQDDDRIKVVITPPTGISNYIITYVVIGLIGLIVVSVGVIFIKKKVLIK